MPTHYVVFESFRFVGYDRLYAILIVSLNPIFPNKEFEIMNMGIARTIINRCIRLGLCFDIAIDT